MNDLDDLLEKSVSILKREVSSIMLESFEGKLSSESAKDLSTYVKLLADLSQKQTDVLETLTEEDLKKILDEDNQRDGQNGIASKEGSVIEDS